MERGRQGAIRVREAERPRKLQREREGNRDRVKGKAGGEHRKGQRQRQRPEEARTSREEERPSTKLQGQAQIGGSEDWRGCRARWRVVGPARDLSLTSDF